MNLKIVTLRDICLDYEFEVKDGPLHNLFKNFKNVLIHDLKIEKFADMYAQTIAYGLFSARVSHEGEFEIKNVENILPDTNPFLNNSAIH